MVTRSMFPITEEQIRNPEQISSLQEFKELVPPSERTESFFDAYNHMRDQLASGRFVVALIWPDGFWCVLYDSYRRWAYLFPGVIEEAYRAAQRGEHFLPLEGRSRAAWSCGRTGL